jgi:hypothetical protein
MAKGFCPNCDTIRSSGTGSCPVCGTLLHPVPNGTDPAPRFFQVVQLLALIIVLVLVLLLVARLLPGSSSTATPTAPVATEISTSAAVALSPTVTATPTRRPTAPATSPTATPTLAPATATPEPPSATPEPPTPTATPIPEPTAAPPPPTPRPTAAPVLRAFAPRINRSYSLDGAYGNRDSCIIGRVRSTGGGGIGGAVLYANNGASNTSSVTTNANGEYSICQLGDSRWSIVLTFVPRPGDASRSRLARQAVAVVILNGNSDQIASVDFFEQ